MNGVYPTWGPLPHAPRRVHDDGHDEGTTQTRLESLHCSTPMNHQVALSHDVANKNWRGDGGRGFKFFRRRRCAESNRICRMHDDPHQPTWWVLGSGFWLVPHRDGRSFRPSAPEFRPGAQVIHPACPVSASALSISRPYFLLYN